MTEGLMDEWTDGQKNNVALAQPYHLGKSYNKFS